MADTPKKDLTNIFDMPKTEQQAEQQTQPDSVDAFQLSDPVLAEPEFEATEPLPVDALPPVSPEMQETIAQASAETHETLTDTVLDQTMPLPPEPDVTAPVEMTGPIVAPSEPAITGSQNTLQNIRQYSETVRVQTPIEAQTPYSLLIVGTLLKHEQERLISIISRANIGLREVELEPQFEAGRILIPRISEYLGIVIVQALRDSKTKMLLGPAEKIFSNEETQDGSHEFYEKNQNIFYTSREQKLEYEQIPITSDKHLSHQPLARVIDTVHTSLALKHSEVHAQRPDALNEALENAKNHLRALAFHKKAKGITQFTYQLIPLAGDPPSYKLIAQGVIVSF